jgi:hypothetical protein
MRMYVRAPPYQSIPHVCAFSRHNARICACTCLRAELLATFNPFKVLLPVQGIQDRLAAARAQLEHQLLRLTKIALWNSSSRCLYRQQRAVAQGR